MSYVNPHSVLGVGITFTITSILAVGARFGVRIRHGLGLGVDDWLCLPAMGLVVAMSCLFIAGYATDTIGSHSPDIGQAIFVYHSDKQSLLKIFEFVFYELQVLSLTFLKLSVLFFYRRLFVGKAFNVAFWVLASFSVAWGLAFVIAWGADCQNFENRIYSLMTSQTKCANGFAILVSQSVFDVAVDLGILVLPIPFVVRLQMSIQRKLAVLATLVIGGLAIACGMTRMIIVAQILGLPLFVHATVGGESSTDFSGIVSVMVFWGMIECGVAMIAICLPTLTPMLRGVTVERMMHSLKSFVSLTSLNSAGRSRATRMDASKEDRSTHYTGSSDTERHTFARGNPSAGSESGEEPSKDEVWVKRDVNVSASVV